MRKVLTCWIAMSVLLSHVMMAQSPVQNTYGICIGIAKYELSELILKWADTDAEAFCGFLQDTLGLSENQYRLATNREATKQNILKQFEWLQSVAKSGDRVYIFYAGYGSQHTPILPYNSANPISLDELKKALGQIKAKEIVLLVDANYSGKIAPETQAIIERKGLNGWTKPMVVELAQATKSNMSIMTSADGIQTAYELVGQEHGLFTDHLMRVLTKADQYDLVDRDGNGALSLAEVYDRVFGLVANESEQRVQITDSQKAKELVVLWTREPAATVVTVPASTPMPTPVSIFTPLPPSLKPEKKGMSKTKIVAIGLGAAAALGGGIALAVSGNDSKSSPTPTPIPCVGVIVGGYCWYLGDLGQSCSEVCASHGGYHDATRTYAGSEGSSSNCWQVLDALHAPQGDSAIIYYDCGTYLGGIGCSLYSYLKGTSGSVTRRYCVSPTTTPDAKNDSWYGYEHRGFNRTCACNN
jgi:hypothetical protein